MVPDLRSAHPLRHDAVLTISRVITCHNFTSQPWSDATCPLNLFKCLLSLCHALFARKDMAKSWKRWYRGKFSQTMVDSRYCLNCFIPGCEATRGQEPGHKRRTLEYPSVCGQLHEVPCRRGTKNELDMVFLPFRKRVRKLVLNCRT